VHVYRSDIDAAMYPRDNSCASAPFANESEFMIFDPSASAWSTTFNIDSEASVGSSKARLKGVHATAC
jgi:hypothetical protein